jgi:hypothetical protein
LTHINARRLRRKNCHIDPAQRLHPASNQGWTAGPDAPAAPLNDQAQDRKLASRSGAILPAKARGDVIDGKIGDIAVIDGRIQA